MTNKVFVYSSEINNVTWTYFRSVCTKTSLGHLHLKGGGEIAGRSWGEKSSFAPHHLDLCDKKKTHKVSYLYSKCVELQKNI